MDLVRSGLSAQPETERQRVLFLLHLHRARMMKRPRDDPPNTPVPSDATDRLTKRPPAPKRAKANQACASCRKNKTRCELLEPMSCSSCCHRCNVLSITCSFETNAPPVQAADDSPHTLARRQILNSFFSIPQCPVESAILGSAPPSTVTSPWEFLKVPGILDWTATPMLAMLTLSKMACNAPPVMQPVSGLAFTDVLTSDQRHYLLCLWVPIILPLVFEHLSMSLASSLIMRLGSHSPPTPLERIISWTLLGAQ